MADPSRRPEVPGRRWTALSRRLDGVQVPVLLLGMAVQFVAIVSGSVPLAVAGLALGALLDVGRGDGSGSWSRRLRRAGLGVLQRTTLRLLLLVAALAVTGTSRVLAILLAGLVVLLVLAARTVQVTLRRIGQRQPPTGVRRLGETLDLAGFYPLVAWWRLTLVGLVAAAELPIAVGVLLWEVRSPAVGAGLLLVTGAAVVGVALGSALWSRRFLASGRVERYRQALATEVAALDTEVVVYFSGGRASTYQLNQWLPVLDRLEPRPLLLLRESVHLRRLVPNELPILLARRQADVELVLAADPKVALYVANAGRNIHLWRYGRMRHVFLNHGDSDKISSANPVVKVYDELYVAGEVAIERYEAAGIGLPRDRFRLVGRPQLDGLLTGRRRLGDGPTTVLYAPTWEGYFPAADYSSVVAMGEAMITHLLAHHPDLRIVFKPHPLSGRVLPEAAQATAAITRRLREAGGNHIVAADHPELDLLAWFDRTDVLLSDISAVVTDFLQTDKPYLVTNPRGLTRTEFLDRFPSHQAAYVVDPDLAGLSALLAAATGADPLADERARMKRLVLGEHPDGPFATFVAALAASTRAAEVAGAQVTNTFAYDDPPGG